MRRRLNILFLQTAMADTATPAVIRRADYTPPAFLIDTVALEFDLVPERTVVRNTMRLRRNPDAAPTATLELMGEQMEFIGATLDGRPHADVHVNENGLSVSNIPDAFELNLESTCNPGEKPSLSGRC